MLRLDVRLFLGPSQLARDMPLAVSGRVVAGRLSGVFSRRLGRRAKTPVARGVRPGSVLRYRLPGKPHARTSVVRHLHYTSDSGV